MIIFSNKCGQLGNRLFAFAHLIANAIEYSYPVVNMSFDEYARYFQSTKVDVLCRYPPRASAVKGNSLRSILFLANKAVLKILRWFRFMSSPVHATVIADLPEYKFTETRHFDLKLEAFLQRARSTSIVFLFGRFFRDYENFEKHQDRIREFFRPLPAIQAQAESTVNCARSNADLVVGVHIRWGDYSEFAGGKYYFSLEEYGSKMSELAKSCHPRRVSFVVCSNENIDITVFRGLMVIPGPGHLVADMYSFAECDYIMGPPSTYTLWASFYGRKPLYQIRDIRGKITLENFVTLPKEVLYNFSFN